jgi:D-alanine-D-alanine ligase
MEKRKAETEFAQKGRRPRSKTNTLGPVRNLEEHVASDWWCKLFNSLYLKTDGDVVDDAQVTRSEIDVVCQNLSLGVNDRILDLCCGQGRHSLELARRGFRNVDGLDRSHYLIQKAKERAKAEGLGVKFREGDARKLPYPNDSFEAVIVMGNSFGYFETSQDDLRVLREVLRVLKPWGKLLIDIADGQYLRDNFLPRSWEWIDRNLFVCRERSLSLDGQRLVSREVITHVAKGVIADQFYAERLYTRDSLSKLLEAAGLRDVGFPDQLITASQRAQDLGMMERRIIVTAQARKQWAGSKQRTRKTHKNVVVILGDPARPDRLKPLNVFDDDDLYTIDKMKEALLDVGGYRFSYIDTHETLMRDLMRCVGKVDFAFNLCDEGYDNDPRKELHVPAILESLGIPYTGAGPQCLAFCYDKSLVRGVAKEMGIPVPEAFFIKPEDSTFELPFDFPVIVKPNSGDSSFGITARSVAHDAEQLINAIFEIRHDFGYDKPILVEELLTGKDITAGIIGNPPSSYIVLPIIEEDYSALPPGLPRICGYEAKWRPDSPYSNLRSIPAELPGETHNAIVQWSVVLSERLECRDYTRFDWRLDAEGTPKLLEVNPNPGWCWDGHLAKMAGLAGMSYSDMLAAILRATEERLEIATMENGQERAENGKNGEELKQVISLRAS